MERFYVGFKANIWYIGFYVAKTEEGTLVAFSLLPLTVIVRIGGPQKIEKAAR